MNLSKKSLAVFVLPLMLLSLVLILGVPGSSDANTQLANPQFVRATPEPVEWQQPDGTTLTIQLVGDEATHYARTLDGYTVMQDEKGFYRYAKQDQDGNMVMSQLQAQNPEIRGQKDLRFLQSIKPGLMFSEKQVLEGKYNRHKDEDLANLEFAGLTNAFPSSGTRRYLVILVNFTDKAFVKTNANFAALYNTDTVSFKNYYLATSYNALTVNTDVYGPYNLSGNMATYGANDSSGYDINPRLMVQEAVDAAEAAGVNFANYDNNGDGTLDGLQVVHAGYGEEAGAPANTIWSHQWTLSTYARTYDGVYINTYSTVPELYGASGSTITGVGVVAHEFAHNLGCPDTYDTSGGTAWDLYYWDIMAAGSWNNSGNNPPFHNPYARWQLGWTTPTTITATSNITLNSVASANVAYRYDTTTTDEYFLVENRQQTGNWDYYLPGHGMLVFHVDGNWIASHQDNDINTSATHQGIDIEEADNVRSTTTFAADPFPGTGAKTSFTDTTTPNSKSWASANTNKPITAIAEASGVITFTITFGSTPVEYCTSASTNTSDEWIAGVVIGSMSKTSTASYYSDFTAYTANLTKGSSTSLTLTPGYSGTAYNEYWAVFIDYNQNKSFTDTGETVYSGSGTTAKTGSFTVPTTALTGTTRIRVSMKYNAAPTSCETFTYGEVEDYTANITTSSGSAPVAAFTANSTSITVGGTVTFTDQSTNTPTSWSWTFTGGTPSTSTTQNPTVTYNTAGTYAVALTATNAYGSNTLTKTAYITVTSSTYCTAASTNTNDEWIARVRIGTIDNSTTKSFYSNFTSISTNLTRGASVTVTLNPGYTGTVYSEAWRLFIDYNKDSDFADTGETVFSKTGTSQQSGTFTVSSTASTGATRLRVTMKYSTYATACGSFTYGEVEDYTVNIL